MYYTTGVRRFGHTSLEVTQALGLFHQQQHCSCAARVLLVCCACAARVLLVCCSCARAS